MNLLHMADAYISQHARNLDTDAIQHIKGFAAVSDDHFHGWLASLRHVGLHIEQKAEGTYWRMVDTAETETKAAVETVETAVHELETHAEGSFEHLLKAQSEGSQ